MSLILAAHGTRRPGGVTMIGDLAARVGALLGQTVQVSFVDVLGPTPSEVLAASTDPRAIVVPAFLSRGYHVRTDLPAHVAASGHRNVVVTPALGPGGQVVRILADQIAQIGWRQGDSVILGAAGTSDAHARARSAHHRDAVVRTDRVASAAGLCRCGRPAYRPGRREGMAMLGRDAWWWRPICCPMAYFNSGCTRPVLTWSADRWALIRGRRG